MLAQVVYAGVGGIQTYTVTFPFLEQADVFATVNGVAKVLTTNFTINAAGTQLTFNGGTTLVGGERIVIYRVTPRLASERLVDFVNGSTPTDTDFDTSALQLLYIVQEAFDLAGNALPLTVDGSNVWDALNKRLTNAGAPSLPNDVIRLVDLQAALIANGNLPPVTAGNNDSGLFVSAGAWAVRTAAQVRTHLALGTAALLDVGITANKVVQLNGSAQYPANDGALIPLTTNPDVHKTPTMVVSYVSQGVLNTVAGTWNTDSAGVLGRMDITVSATDEKFDTGNKMSTDTATDLIALEAGTYEIVLNLAFGNTGVAATSNIDVMLTNAAGTSLLTIPSITLGAILSGSTYSNLHIVHRTVLVTLNSPDTYCVKARHNNAAGSVSLVGAGSQVTVRRLG